MLVLRHLFTMRPSLRLAVVATIAGLLTHPSHQQTYSSCNPTEQSDCPPDPALGSSVSIDFTSGASSQFDVQGSPAVTYDSSNGATFTISAAGDAPQLNSKWYIMFGKYEVTMKVAPGAGIVSSIVLESNDLDEIDWELLGAEADQAQTNYFGKGQTTTYDRATIVAVDNTEGDWHTYGVEWTSEQIVWSVDGQTVRVLTSADADDQYPQTPCQLKVGIWAGGDPSNAPGTISWAHGPTDYSDGPFTMYVQSIAVTDYSTGSQYTYGNTSGDWQSIESTGGTVNGNAPAGGTDTSAPPTATTTDSPSPWTAGDSPPGTVSATNYPGLPPGWTVNPQTGKVVPPPNAAPAVAVPVRFACLGVVLMISGMILGVWI